MTSFGNSLPVTNKRKKEKNEEHSADNESISNVTTFHEFHCTMKRKKKNGTRNSESRPAKLNISTGGMVAFIVNKNSSKSAAFFFLLNLKHYTIILSLIKHLEYVIRIHFITRQVALPKIK